MHFRCRLNENQETSKACNNVSRQDSCIPRQLSHLNVTCTVHFLENNQVAFDKERKKDILVALMQI